MDDRVQREQALDSLRSLIESARTEVCGLQEGRSGGLLRINDLGIGSRSSARRADRRSAIRI
ncbi:MAG: hypothetical protein EDS66_11690 [Planctomycetota bacterium]|nr:MAG: hypothetical protein EDS66_11690 [Planctomycetota bacterium]MCQ3922272.1 hypothetical protein [Planctomycetota bacterium]